MEANAFLIDWAIRFLENRDMIIKEIVSIEKSRESFVVKYKDREKNFIVNLIITGKEDGLLKTGTLFPEASILPQRT